MATKQRFADELRQQHIFFDGKMVKSIDLPQYPDEAWNWLTGKPDAARAGVEQYWKAIPWLFRGVQLRAQAVAGMPFALVDKSGNDFDHSQEWENKLGFLPNPSDLLWLIEAALTLTGKCYLWRRFQGLQTLGLRYILPTSISWEARKDQAGNVVFDKNANRPAVTWKRDLGQGPKVVPDGSIIYLWQPDPYVEFGEPTACPAKAALMAAGVLANVDEFVAGFFKRGAIKATIFTAENMPPGEREKFENWWKQFIGGIRNAWSTKILNAQKMTPVTVGEGVAELQDQELTKEKREDIATALGIPITLLFSGSAAGLGGGGVMTQDDLSFYDKTVVPEAKWIAGALTDQVFGPLGYRMVIRHETLDVFQEDENQRAQAVKLYTDAGFPLLMACDILGVELTDEQRAELEKAMEEKKARAEELTSRLANAPQPPEQPQPGQNGKQPGDDTPRREAPQNEMAEDVKRWQKKSLKALEKGKPAAVPFESDHIPDTVAERISAELADASTEGEVKAIFERVMDYWSRPHLYAKWNVVDNATPALQLLAEQLQRANDLLERTTDVSAITV